MSPHHVTVSSWLTAGWWGVLPSTKEPRRVCEEMLLPSTKEPRRVCEEMVLPSTKEPRRVCEEVVLPSTKEPRRVCEEMLLPSTKEPQQVCDEVLLPSTKEPQQVCEEVLLPSSCALLLPRRQLLTQWVLEAWQLKLGGDGFEARPDEVEALIAASDLAAARALHEILSNCEPALPRRQRLSTAKVMSDDEFVVRHMLANEPVLFEEGLISSWRMRSEWCRDGAPDLDSIEKAIGNERSVPVSFAPHEPCRRTSFGEFADAWRASKPVYLKDWPFQLEGFETMAPRPRIFSLFRNWLSRPHERDYVFLYLGRAHTSTRLHADVLNSFSWSANVCGTKRWLLLPARDTWMLKDATGKHVSADFYTGNNWTRCRCGSTRFFPHLHRAEPIECLQAAGQVIFVPSGWYHTVHNLDDALSVNANWITACNGLWALARLEAEDADAKSPTFGGDNFSKRAFLDVLLDSLRTDIESLRKQGGGVSTQPRHLLLFQIQRAAALSRILLADLDAASRNRYDLLILDEADAVLVQTPPLHTSGASCVSSTRLADNFFAICARQCIKHGIPLNEMPFLKQSAQHQIEGPTQPTRR